MFADLMKMDLVKDGGMFAVCWLIFLAWFVEAGYYNWNMDTIIPNRIIPGHKFVVVCDLATAYNDVNIPMNGSHVITLSMSPNAPNTFVPGTVSVLMDKDKPRRSLSLEFPGNMKTGNYRGLITVTKDGVSVGTRTFYPKIHSDSVDSQFLLVQTDKGIYKAGQTIQFRVLVINYQRKVVKETFTIEIFDADSNRVRRWANVSDSGGVYVGRMEMSNYPVLGKWTIKVSNEKFTKATYFDVEEFELPKFYVELDFPQDVTTASGDSLNGKVSALYTFGKGVSGDLELTFKYSSYSAVKQYKVKDGSVKIDLPFTELASDFQKSYFARDIFNATRYYTSVLRLTILANVVEDVTGVNISAESFINVRAYDVAVGLKFQQKFHIGQDVDISGEITRYSGDPYPGIASADVDVWVEIRLYLINRKWVIIRNSSRIDVSEDNTFSYTVEGNVLHSNVSYIYTRAVLRKVGTTKDIYSRGYNIYPSTNPLVNSSLTLKQVSGPKVLTVGDSARFRISVTGEMVTATYKVVSNGWYVDEGEWFDLSEGQPKEITVTATEEMRPNFVVMAWSVRAIKQYYTDGINEGTDALQVDIKPDEATEVKTRISFDKKEVRPGDAANIHLEGNANSNFYLLSVDKSILILDPGNDITEELLPSLDNGENTITLDDSSFSSILRSVWLYYTGISLRERTADLITTTQSSSTSTLGFEPSSTTPTSTTPSFSSSLAAEPPTTTTPVFASSSSITTSQPRSKDIQDKSVTLRKKFPNTWLFNNVTSGATGIAEFTATAPDTITTWVATCFAIDGNSHLSVAYAHAENLSNNVEKLRVFLPFFVSVQLPFSVLRNEQVVIQANVFNYHSEDLYILVTLKKSDSFRGLAVSKRGKSRKLKEKCGDLVLCILAKSGRATPAFFPIVPLEIGDMKLTIQADSEIAKDTVVKDLRVEPEGAERSVAYPVLIDLSQKNTFDYRFQLSYPGNVVEGSKRLRLTLNGDVMGPTIDNLDRLVRHPYGCGEQNMISTAPSVFVMGYLTAVDRLDTSLEKLAENFIGIAPDGLQTLGLVFQCLGRVRIWEFMVFSKGTFYVDVDERVITLPSAYLLSIQNKDGSFPERGHVNSRYMQGGSVGTVERMTAYVLIALLEAKHAGSKTIKFSADQESKLEAGIKSGMKFLEQNLDNITSVYSLAITTYALGLGESKLASDALLLLKSNAKTAGDMLYWEETAPVPSKYHYGPSTTAVSIEMTAYALLSMSISGDKVDGARVNKWLIGQRSPYGGFISTQDTMIGLEALAAFGALMKSAPADMTIWISYMDDRHHKRKFRITPENAMVLQTVDLSTDTSEISVHALGESKAIITVSLFYNIFMDLEDQDLRLAVDVVKESVNGFTVRSCISWLEEDISGMVVAEIGIPSGFNAFRYGISGHELLMRTEIQEKKVVLYFDQVTEAKVCVDISMVRDTMVASVKPVPCTVYEYYEPSNEMTVFYAPLKAKNSNICDVCGIECECVGGNDRMWMPMKWCKTKVG